MLKIAHLSDQHVRNFKRHDEYRQCFDHLYVSLREKQPDIIVITGDVGHAKNQISPEFVQMCAEYFENLVKIAPLHLIPGNHDLALSNLTRLDAITPIVEALNNSNIHFYKNSGIYPVNLGERFLNFVVFSCLDNNWPTKESMQKAVVPMDIDRFINIGLYHGFVDGAELQNGQIIEGAISVNEFLNKVDYLLLGDIHKHQILDSEYRSAYAGSYPQQNYGEASELKGYLLWQIESKEKHTVDLVTLPNVSPFYTLRLEDSLEIPEDLDYQERARIRILSKQLNISEKEHIRNRINTLYKPCELKFLDEINPYRQKLKLSSVDAKIENLNESAIQEKLIEKFLEPERLDEKILDKIFEINRRFNIHVRKEDDMLRNVQYRLGKMKWANTFSYGGNNEFNFSDYKGLVGIFGKNGTGKSSLAVDIPLYCMFNKTAKKITKNDLIINENKNSCAVELEIILGKDVYKISRETDTYLKSGKKSDKPVYQGRTSVDFKIYHQDGTVENKNGPDRIDTDENIRKIFGTANDFMATSIAPQWQLLNFINLGGTERQKMIGRYFGVDIFEKKHILAKEELKETRIKLKAYQGKDLKEEREKRQLALNILKEEIERNEKQKEYQEKSKARIEESIEDFQKQIINIELDANLTEKDLDTQISDAKLKVIEKKKEISIANKKLAKNTETVSKLHNELLELDKKALEERYNTYKLLQRVVRDDKEDKDKLLKDVKRLESYSCLSNSNCCMLKELQEVQNNIKDYEYDIMISQEKIDNTNIQELTKQIKRYETIEKEIAEIPSSNWDGELLKEKQTVFRQLVDDVAQLEKKKKTFLKNKEQFIKNAEIEDKLKAYKFRKDKVDEALQETLRNAVELSTKFGANKTLLAEIKASESEYVALKRNYKAYSHFIDAMSKDGISKTLIADNLDIINGEIKKVLAQGVGFDIELESTVNGKEIEIYFKHEKCPKRRIELLSGMEQTIAAIAIRAALIGVTTLPKSNIYVLDEVFIALDDEYMTGLINILEYLKQLFETVIIITHIDIFRDVVDHAIEIERDDNGYARISE